MLDNKNISKAIFDKVKPDWVLVQGDTATVLAASLAASLLKIKVGYVEAGLRSFDLKNPFPEELNRRLASVTAELHFAPTKNSKDNLLNENMTKYGHFYCHFLMVLYNCWTKNYDLYMILSSIVIKNMIFNIKNIQNPFKNYDFS